MGHRRPEHGHHGVADELLHGPAEDLNTFLCSRPVCIQRVPDVLRVRSFRLPGEADQVHEEH